MTFTYTYCGVNARLAECLFNSVLNVKALVDAFNQEKALVGAFSVIVQLRRLIVNSSSRSSWPCSSSAGGGGRRRHNPTYKVKVWRGGRGGSKLVGIRVKTLLSFTLRMIYDFLLFPGLMMTNRLNLNQSCDTVSNCHCYT